MSRAIQCNRCGLCFNPTCIQDKGSQRMYFSNPRIIVQTDEPEKRVTSTYFPDTPEFEHVDLCDKCSRDFMDFMNGEPIEKNY